MRVFMLNEKEKDIVIKFHSVLQKEIAPFKDVFLLHFEDNVVVTQLKNNTYLSRTYFHDDGTIIFKDPYKEIECEDIVEALCRIRFEVIIFLKKISK